MESVEHLRRENLAEAEFQRAKETYKTHSAIRKVAAPEAEDSLEKVVKELTVVASEKCKEEVAAHHRCLEANGSTSAACVGTDEAALNCAAKHVVAAANQMALARSSGD